jgi:hypothetical protein
MGEELLRVGEAALRLPPGCRAKLLSGEASRRDVLEFVLKSPEQTVYHHEPYFEYARGDDAGGPCELALFLQEGNPAFALPLHFRPPNRVITGYSGILFPPGGTEVALRRSIRSLATLLDANPDLRFEVIQSAQAPAYDDPRRVLFVRRFLAELDLETRPLFTRVLRLDQHARIEEAPSSFPGSVLITPDSLENAQLASYDGDARNQIKRAFLRDGLSVYAFFGDRAAGTTSGYELLQPLHQATWARSGWSPHPLSYWLDLSASINRPEGASDLVVMVSDAGGSPVAGVVCHRYRGRALYWSGCSNDDEGLKRANPLCLHAAISICDATGDVDAREPSRKERAVTSYKSQFRGELLEVVNFTRRARYRPSVIGSQIRQKTGALVARLAH